MGRGKIEIKRIENQNNRQVTFAKRRAGLIKKAKEITVLCEAKVSLVIFSSSGKMQAFCSPSTTVVEILDLYHKITNNPRLWDAKHENLNAEIERIKKENDSMQMELRHLKGEDICSLNHKELQRLEDTLEHGLASLREKQAEYFRIRRTNEKMLEEENKRLRHIYLQQQEIAMEARELENPYHQHRVKEYTSQMPFALPIQPNLHEKM